MVKDIKIGDLVTLGRIKIGYIKSIKEDAFFHITVEWNGTPRRNQVHKVFDTVRPFVYGGDVGVRIAKQKYRARIMSASLTIDIVGTVEIVMRVR